MSRTTTAAEARARYAGGGGPSFDAVWANLPEELSPTSVQHTDSFFCEDEVASPPQVNVSELCRNTFVHLESGSPLARMSVTELLQSFREFSASLSPAAPEGAAGESNPWSPLPRTPETTAQTPAAAPRPAVDELRVIDKGNICQLVKKYTFRNAEDEDEAGEALILLNPSPISQSLITAKKDPPSPNEASAAPPPNPEAPTMYRDGHPLTCKPCAFYWSKGCLNGDKCQFCHLWHVPKRKKPMREQRNLMVIAKDDGKITYLRCSIKDVI